MYFVISLCAFKINYLNKLPTTSHAITAKTEEENGNQTLEQDEPTTTRSVCEDEVVQALMSQFA